LSRVLLIAGRIGLRGCCRCRWYVGCWVFLDGSVLLCLVWLSVPLYTGRVWCGGSCYFLTNCSYTACSSQLTSVILEDLRYTIFQVCLGFTILLGLTVSLGGSLFVVHGFLSVHFSILLVIPVP